MAVVEVIDERREPARQLIGTFQNVPDQWTIPMIAQRFGIAEHLGFRVTRDFPYGGDQVAYRHPTRTSITSIR